MAPYIFNAMLERLDLDLLAALTEGFVYTGYSDDMCFSCRDDKFTAELEGVIRSIVEAHGFRINAKKTRRGRGGIVDLPGVVIKEGRVRPNGTYRKKLQEGWRFLLPKQIAGHRSYVSSFGHSGDLRVLRPLIGNRTKSRRQPSEEGIGETCNKKLGTPKQRARAGLKGWLAVRLCMQPKCHTYETPTAP